MKLIERSFTLPEETVNALEEKVDRQRQGELLAELIQNWLNEQPKSSLRDEVIAGCIDMADVSIELERDFNPLEEEVHRGIEY
ncbi:MAG TPA: hypothetical protein VKX17_11215 [Planctomycetota bacterium]|nr:hypothetical protein [Planctomycetota bacterium]